MAYIDIPIWVPCCPTAPLKAGEEVILCPAFLHRLQGHEFDALYLAVLESCYFPCDDTVYLLWNGSVGATPLAPQRIFFARSTDHGHTYSARVEVSNAPASVEHCFPALVTGWSAGDVRIGWMDMRTGAWNVFYRSSLDGGSHFSDVTRISSYVPGYPYLTPAGFALPYGDYFSMAVDTDNKTQAAFGEGPSYAGPGNQWTSRQMED